MNFTKLNRKNIQDRQMDTLIGLSKGITADGTVNKAEAVFLETWLVQNCYTENPIILNLLGLVHEMLSDNKFDEEESGDLLSILRKFSGDKVELGEVSKTSTLPICVPLPHVVFTDKTFLFTGTCAFGTRKQCQKEIDLLGGINAKTVTKTLNYLILGTYVTDSWAHESFGRKIEKAMEYRDSGLQLSIITEKHWLHCSDLL